MQFFDIVILACVFALDAVLVAFSYGLITQSWTLKDGLKISLVSGFFQFIMPLIGYFLFKSASLRFERYSALVDHWIVFIVFALLGAKIIKDSLSQESQNLSFSFGALLVIGIATSLDSLAGGVMIYTQNSPILESAIIIGAITFVLVISGYNLSKLFSSLPHKLLGICGGMILILLGSKILFQHLLQG